MNFLLSDSHTRQSFVVTAALLLAPLSLGACLFEDTITCDPGFVEQDGACVALDAGVQDSGTDVEDLPDSAADVFDGGTPDAPDGGPDAGPCRDCGGEAPLCHTETMTCVECLAPADCEDAAKPICGAGSCVECVDSTQCTAPEGSVCGEDNACAACGESMDCAGVEDGDGHALNVCDDSGETPLCVECTPATEDADCGANACDPAMLLCTDTARASQGVCEACASDSECEAGLGCVPMMYRGEALPGGYCMTIVALDPCEQPYATTLDGRTTLSGVAGARYCGIDETLARCEAVLALIDNAQCAGGLDMECPGDGLCRRVGESVSMGGGGLANRCTYECDSSLHCPSVANQDTCGTGYLPADGDAEYCGGGAP